MESRGDRVRHRRPQAWQRRRRGVHAFRVDAPYLTPICCPLTEPSAPLSPCSNVCHNRAPVMPTHISPPNHNASMIIGWLPQQCPHSSGRSASRTTQCHSGMAPAASPYRACVVIAHIASTRRSTRWLTRAMPPTRLERTHSVRPPAAPAQHVTAPTPLQPSPSTTRRLTPPRPCRRRGTPPALPPPQRRWPRRAPPAGA